MKTSDTVNPRDTGNDSYIESVFPEEKGILKELREYALAYNVPVIRPGSSFLLRTLTSLKNPKKILEAGTAIGYSAILMGECCPEAIIHTVEIDQDTAVLAMENIRKSGNGSIRVIVGDCVEVFSSLSGTYDMIFVDSAKGQYIHMFDDIVRLLNPGGLLVCDDCCFYGKISSSPEDAPHKHRTIISNMRNFIDKIMNSGYFTASLISEGDGMLIATRTGKRPEGAK